MAQLNVFHRLTLDGLGGAKVSRFVHCPARGECVEVEACDTCGYGRGGEEDDEKERVECAQPDASEATKEESYPGSVRVVPSFALATKDVVTATPETPVLAIRRAFLERAIGCVVVIDALGVPIGIVSPADLLEQPTASVASEAMKRTVVTVGTMTPSSRAAALMSYEGIHHLPVINDAGQLVGLLSSLDILRHLGDEAGFLVPKSSRRRG